MRESCFCCSNNLWPSSNASFRLCMERRGDICPSKPYTLTNIHTSGLGVIFSLSTFCLQWNLLPGVIPRDSSRQTQTAAKRQKLLLRISCLQEVQEPWHMAGGLPQSADLGIAHFPWEEGQQWSAKTNDVHQKQSLCILSVRSEPPDTIHSNYHLLIYNSVRQATNTGTSAFARDLYLSCHFTPPQGR